jgi:hypothetical protein
MLSTGKRVSAGRVIGRGPPILIEVASEGAPESATLIDVF